MLRDTGTIAKWVQTWEREEERTERIVLKIARLTGLCIADLQLLKLSCPLAR